VPKLRPRPQNKPSRLAYIGYFNNGIPVLNSIPEGDDQIFASPGYFDPENLCRSDSGLSSDVFGVDVSSGLDKDSQPSSTSDEMEGSVDDDDNVITPENDGDGTSLWNQMLQQVRVVTGKASRNIDAAGANEYDEDADINVGNISHSYTSESGGDDGVSQLSTGYSC
jgi:hypothetical protein